MVVQSILFTKLPTTAHFVNGCDVSAIPLASSGGTTSNQSPGLPTPCLPAHPAIRKITIATKY